MNAPQTIRLPVESEDCGPGLDAGHRPGREAQKHGFGQAHRERGHQNEQRPFWLKAENDATLIYGLGAELDAGALVCWLEPETGHTRFSGFLSAADALLQMQATLGSTVRLIVVWDEREVDHTVPLLEEELTITKAAVEPISDCRSS